MTELECVLLTGGASRRMGTDKASLTVGGEPMVERLARQLLSVTPNVTLMGPHRVEGCRTVPDDHAHLGPLHALARFEPRASKVFVLACDVPLFDPRLVPLLSSLLEQENDAAVPLWQGTAQPLCALYRDRAFGELRLLSKLGENRLMPWLSQIAVRYVTSEQIAKGGLDPRCVAGADTPEALEALLQHAGGAENDAG
ncbi:MAG: molybdenum cofactor guanylyltransferase [Armatimonadota bacterium]